MKLYPSTSERRREPVRLLTDDLSIFFIFSGQRKLNVLKNLIRSILSLLLTRTAEAKKSANRMYFISICLLQLLQCVLRHFREQCSEIILPEIRKPYRPITERVREYCLFSRAKVLYLLLYKRYNIFISSYCYYLFSSIITNT